MSDYEGDDGYHTESEYLAGCILPCKITEEVTGTKPNGIPCYMDRVDEAFAEVNRMNRHVPTVFTYPILFKHFQAEGTRKECPSGSENLEIIEGLCSGWVMHSSFADDYATVFAPPCDDCLAAEFLSAWSKSRARAILLFSTFACKPVVDATKNVEEEYELLKKYTPDHRASEKLYNFCGSLDFKLKAIPAAQRKGLLVEFLVFMKDLCAKLADGGNTPRVGDKRPFEDKVTE